MGFWSKLFGNEAEIDYSKPIPTAFLTPSAVDNCGRNDLPAQVKERPAAPPTSNPVRSRKLSAHGKRSGKPKSRSQKKLARKSRRK